jgi:hypothetical protein
MGIRGTLIHCADYRCTRSTAVSADQWPDGLRLSDIEPRFVCQACGKGHQRALLFLARLLCPAVAWFET